MSTSASVRLLIDGARIDRQARRLGGEALLGVRQAKLVADEVHQVRRILAVVDGEGRVEPDRAGIFAQQPRPDAMERAGPGKRRRHARRRQRTPDDPLDAAGHLVGRAAREGHQQDAAGIGAVDHQMRDAMRQRIGLARAGAGDNEQRASRCSAHPMGRRPPLVGVERIEGRGGHLLPNQTVGPDAEQIRFTLCSQSPSACGRGSSGRSLILPAACPPSSTQTINL